MFLASSVIALAIISVASAVPESTCSAASRSPSPSAVPFEARRDSQIVVPLYLDGTGPWRFLVDTGAGRSAISYAVVSQIGVSLVTAGAGGGTDSRPVARLTNLTVGCARAQALLAPTLSQAEVRQLGSDVVGVLGQDFLSRFSYTLDYRANRLVWEFGGDADRDETAVPEGRRIVRLPLHETDDGFVVDVAGTRFVPASAVSATQGIVLFPGARTNQLLANSAALAGELLPFENQRAARVVRLKRLQIGAATLWDVPGLVLVAAVAADPVDAEGLLPLSLFARVTFRPQLGYLEVEPR